MTEKFQHRNPSCLFFRYMPNHLETNKTIRNNYIKKIVKKKKKGGGGRREVTVLMCTFWCLKIHNCFPWKVGTKTKVNSFALNISDVFVWSWISSKFSESLSHYCSVYIHTFVLKITLFTVIQFSLVWPSITCGRFNLTGRGPFPDWKCKVLWLCKHRFCSGKIKERIMLWWLTKKHKKSYIRQPVWLNCLHKKTGCI